MLPHLVVREAEVVYLWHPWTGCIVQIHEVVEKASGNVARCGLDGATVCRALELPVWMLDRAACASIRMDTCPRVDVAALDALTTLLALGHGRRTIEYPGSRRTDGLPR